MGCGVYWREFSEEEVTLGDVKGFCQLKMLPSSGSVYLTLWSLSNNSVTPIPSLKKGFRHGWFIA